MDGSLRRAARRALKPNAIILGVATCLFGWSLTEALRVIWEADHFTHYYCEQLYISSFLLVAAVSVATRGALANLLAAALSGPVPLLLLSSFLETGTRADVTFLGLRHFEVWLGRVGDAPSSIWLLAALSFAILCSATTATLRRTASRA